MNIYFNKMQALGNDFVVFETLHQTIPITSDLIKKMADRHLGIGCDQVLIIGKSQHPDADFDYSIYNSDGSAAKQCGNGARCVGLFIKEKKLSTKNKITLATFNHLTHVDLTHPEQIKVTIGVPQFDLEKSAKLNMGVLSIGNPHLIIPVTDVMQAKVAELGAAYNSNSEFPEGVNVSFCQVLSRDSVQLRVFERGVGETLACGSAACATMAYLHQLNLINTIVTIHQPGGALTVQWEGNKQPIILTGQAQNVFTGVFYYD